MKFDHVSYLWHFTKYTPVFTGIPPHVTLLKNIESMRSSFVIFIEITIGDMGRIFDDRIIGGL